MRSLGTFEDHIAWVRARQLELGITDDDFARARNSGRGRTPEKQELLRRIEARKKAAAQRSPAPGTTD